MDRWRGPCEQLVAQKGALDGVLGMRKSSDATAGEDGHREREENLWIKSGCRIELEGMSQSRRAGRGVNGAPTSSAGRRKPTDDRLAFDKGHSKMLLAKGQYLSPPSQSLDLRPGSIWLSEGENHLRTWPLGVRGSVHLRSRNSPCRTPSGRLFGPIGRLFRPSGHGHFGVALMSAWPCLRRTPKQVGPKLT